jgi:hypothetical protein
VRDLDGKSVCLVIPDGTRSCPLPLLLEPVVADGGAVILYAPHV